MTINLKINRAKEVPEGFPLFFEISHKGKRKIKTIGICKAEHWIEANGTISHKHPDYEYLMPRIMQLKDRARQIVVSGVEDIEVAYKQLNKQEIANLDFLKYANELILQMNVLAAALERKKDLKARNKIVGNVKVYENAIKRLKQMTATVYVSDFNYEFLMKFKNRHLMSGNSKSTVHLYLRTLRAIYNKCILQHELPNKNPFVGVFDGLKLKSYQNKKKYLTKRAVELLEGLSLPGAKQKYVDLWLLQFYFGGCDLIDIYYMKKNQIRGGRVYFERGKTENGLMIDLKIHPKAAAILAKFENRTEFVVLGRKDVKGYEGYRRRYSRVLVEAQTLLQIEVMPVGGNIGVKVARHTFANCAKKLEIAPDLIRELMGHERDDVDNFYKDRFSEKKRDKALFKIVG
jgi:hypothetical protein